MQRGVPERVRDYRSPLIEQAAMPTRVEKWLVDRRSNIAFMVSPGGAIGSRTGSR